MLKLNKVKLEDEYFNCDWAARPDQAGDEVSLALIDWTVLCGGQGMLRYGSEQIEDLYRADGSLHKFETSGWVETDWCQENLSLEWTAQLLGATSVHQWFLTIPGVGHTVAGFDEVVLGGGLRLFGLAVELGEIVGMTIEDENGESDYVTLKVRCGIADQLDADWDRVEMIVYAHDRKGRTEKIVSHTTRLNRGAIGAIDFCEWVTRPRHEVKLSITVSCARLTGVDQGSCVIKRAK